MEPRIRNQSLQRSVELAVLDGLANVRLGDVIGTVEVGDGAGDLEDACVGTGAQVVFGHRKTKERFRA